MSRCSRGLAAAVALAALLPAGARADHERAPSMWPTGRVVRLGTGQTHAIDFTFRRPAQRQSPLDVFVLVDTSASMRPYVPAIRETLRATARSFVGRDVRMGLGEVRTTSVTDWSEDLTYRVLRQPRAVDAELGGAVDALATAEPTVPAPVPANDALAVALDEAVTGDGYSPYVPPGRNVAFRANARKVVVVVTDDPLATDPTQPGRDDLVATLKAAGVKVVGLALDTDALADLTALAAGTGSTAGDAASCGRGSVAAGRPAACAATPAGIAPALARILAEHLYGRVTFAASGSGFARLDAPAATVDLTRDSQHRVTMRVACGPTDAGRTHHVTLRANVSGRTAAAAYTRVECVRRG